MLPYSSLSKFCTEPRAGLLLEEHAGRPFREISQTFMTFQGQASGLEAWVTR
jgi:hypothetical protein